MATADETDSNILICACADVFRQAQTSPARLTATEAVRAYFWLAISISITGTIKIMRSIND